MERIYARVVKLDREAKILELSLDGLDDPFADIVMCEWTDITDHDLIPHGSIVANDGSIILEGTGCACKLWVAFYGAQTRMAVIHLGDDFNMKEIRGVGEPILAQVIS